jgi:hypothetical protein
MDVADIDELPVLDRPGLLFWAAVDIVRDVALLPGGDLRC